MPGRRPNFVINVSRAMKPGIAAHVRIGPKSHLQNVDQESLPCPRDRRLLALLQTSGGSAA